MRNKTVSVKVRGIRKRIEGVLRAVDKGEHGFGNLIVERNGARIIMRGNMVVSVALVDQPKVHVILSNLKIHTAYVDSTALLATFLTVTPNNAKKLSLSIS